MPPPVSGITSLLHDYARRLDAGDLGGVATLLDRAQILVSGRVIGSGRDFVEEFLRSAVIIHPDGTPRTRHVIAQPVIDVADGSHATVRSQFTVLQAGPDGAYVVMVGHHHDAMTVDDGAWRFASRDYGDVTYVGDTSRHLRAPREQG